jgi:hypothetical protein
MEKRSASALLSFLSRIRKLGHSPLSTAATEKKGGLLSPSFGGPPRKMSLPIPSGLLPFPPPPLVGGAHAQNFSLPLFLRLPYPSNAQRRGEEKSFLASALGWFFRRVDGGGGDDGGAGTGMTREHHLTLLPPPPPLFCRKSLLSRGWSKKRSASASIPPCPALPVGVDVPCGEPARRGDDCHFVINLAQW